MQKLKALYRFSGKDQTWFINGMASEKGENGFVFSDFSKKRSFCIQPEIHKVISKKEIETLFFSSNNTSDWKSTTKEDYDFGFSIIKNEIEHKHINKAILSRKCVKDKKVDAVKLFNDLSNNYKDSHVFLTETPGGDLWIGATPETLLENESGFFQTMSLAGTKSDELIEWTEKEYTEQKIVTNAIIAALFKFNITPEISDLETVKAGAVYHLRNQIKFQTIESPLKIAEFLHPTPAISGNPKNQAISTIKIAENHDREYYCGYGGIVKGDQVECLFVNLRCASISKNQICLFLGGGITKKSLLDKEWEECERKGHSLLRYL